MIGTTMLNGNKKTRNLLGLLVIWVGLVLGPTQITGFGQTSGPATNIRVFASDPTGNACSQTSVGLYGGALYTCQAGVYALNGGGGGGGITIGTTTITGGNSGRALYNNSGVVGEYPVTGTAGNAVLSISPNLTGAPTITSTSNPCFAVGPNGATNPTLAVNCSVASAATGIRVTPAAAGSGVMVGVTSSGINENLLLTPKGTGRIVLPAGSAAAPSLASSPTVSSGFFWTSVDDLSVATSGVERFRFGSGGLFSASGGITLGPSAAVPDAYLVRSASGVIRAGSSPTAAAQVLVGTSTDTADAQLSVYSQSATRPGLKLRALSGTAATQEVVQSYDSGGTLTFAVRDNGHMQSPVWRVSTADGVIATNTTSLANVQTANFSAEGGGGRFHWTFPSTVQAIAAFALGGTHNAPNLYLYPDAANTLAQRNSTNAQAFRVYNTYTSGSNYERLGIQASSNAFFITPEAATGTIRELVAGAAGSVTRIRSSLATPSAPALADGDWWVECSGTTPTRTCSVMVRDTGATRTIATSVAF